MKKTFTRLTDTQIQTKVNFIDQYINSTNAASGSTVDQNANVSSKNIATLEAELNKDINIQVNRKLVYNKLIKLFDKEIADEYIRQLESHEIYCHDENSIKPYCCSISLYPFLLDGLTTLGGESKAPKHLESFCGSFINLIFAISSQFAGAIAAVEFIFYLHYFACKEYGKDYLTTHSKELDNHLQHVVYAINQPAAARGYQSIFFNISLYDKYYFESLFGDFVFPDEEGTKPDFEGVNALQKHFMKWFNKEREKALLTFPVITAAMLTQNNIPKDKDFADMCAEELSEGNSFFMYMSDSADSLASCCRLRSDVTDNTFSYSLGAGGVATGSINVITINMNRLIQDKRDLKTEIEKVHKYQVAHRTLIQEYKDAGLLTVYDAGYISLEKQFLTIGINGLVEGAEFLGYTISDNQEYKDFVSDNLKVIFDANKEAKKKYGYMFNTEFVPAENLGVKNASWDKKDGYVVPRDCYNSYFYIVEDDSVNSIDKFVLHGKDMIQYLDGGSALHLNLDQKLTKDGFYKLIEVAAKSGCNYWCSNVKITICNSCQHIDKRTLPHCSKCNSTDIDYGTRVIGYLKRISSFSTDRQREAHIRHYHKDKKIA